MFVLILRFGRRTLFHASSDCASNLVVQLGEGLADGLPVELAPVVPPGAGLLVVVGADEGGEVVLGLSAQGVDGGAAVKESVDHVLLNGPVGGLNGLDLADELLAAVINVGVQNGHEVGVDELEGQEVLVLVLSLPLAPAGPGEEGSLDDSGAEEANGSGDETGVGDEEGASGGGGEGEAGGQADDGEAAVKDGVGGGHEGGEEGAEGNRVHDLAGNNNRKG